MYPPEIGGVETVAKQYVDILSNYEPVIVLCLNNNLTQGTQIEKYKNITIYRCSSFSRIASMPLSIAFFYHFIKLQKHANIIHIHEPFPLATIISLFSMRKIFVTWHSDIIKQKKLGVLFKIFQNKLLRKATTITTTSEALLNSSCQLLRQKDKVKILPLTINSKDYLNITSNKKEENIKDNFALFIGRLSYYKGIETLLDAIEKIDIDIEFLIVGTGEMSYKIQERQQLTQKKITFINRHVSEETKKELLSRCKCMLFPSNHNSEAFGITQLEAMIYGKPVINTNLPTGVPWVSPHLVSGLTIPVNDSTELAKAITLIFTDDIIYHKLSNGALTRVKHLFSNEVLENGLLDIYSLGRKTT